MRFRRSNRRFGIRESISDLTYRINGKYVNAAYKGRQLNINLSGKPKVNAVGDTIRIEFPSGSMTLMNVSKIDVNDMSDEIHLTLRNGDFVIFTGLR